MAPRTPQQPVAKLLLRLLVLRLLLSAAAPRPVQAQPTAHCLSEFALADQACAFATADAEHPEEQKDLLSEQRRRDRDGGGGGGDHEQDSVGSNCCGVLKRLDQECVCDVLQLRLPKSLTKPKHSIKVSAGSSCKVTFKCQGVGL